MKTVVALAIFGACIFGMTSAVTIDAACNGKIQAFKDCHSKIRDQHINDAKQKEAAVDACYTASSCTPPGQGAKPADADRAKKEQCMKDISVTLKAQVEKCVSDKVQGLTLPHDNKNGDEHRGGMRGGHGDKAIQQACGTNTAAVATVKACIQAKAGAQSGPDADRARFDSNCKAKSQCDSLAPDAACKAQLDQAHQTLCECGQTARGNMAQLHTSTPSCAGLPEPKQRSGGKQKSCDASSTPQPDICKDGFDKWQANRKAHQGQKPPGSDGH